MHYCGVVMSRFVDCLSRHTIFMSYHTEGEDFFPVLSSSCRTEVTASWIVTERPRDGRCIISKTLRLTWVNKSWHSWNVGSRVRLWIQICRVGLKYFVFHALFLRNIIIIINLSFLIVLLYYTCTVVNLLQYESLFNRSPLLFKLSYLIYGRNE